MSPNLMVVQAKNKRTSLRLYMQEAASPRLNTPVFNQEIHSTFGCGWVAKNQTPDLECSTVVIGWTKQRREQKQVQ